jgi:ABC-type transporter Mla subunit MlaD
VWGLVEVQGHLVAAIHAGQFRDRLANGNGASEVLSELADATGLGLGQLQDTLAGVPLLDEDRQEQIRHLLQRVATAMAEIAEERLDLVGRLQRIAKISNM